MMHGEVITLRPGRKRKHGKHRSGGRGLVVIDRLSPRAVAAAMPHRRGLPVDFQLDQRAGSELGRMRGTKPPLINESQFLAGEEWARVVGAYLVTIEPPRGLAGGGWKPEISEEQALQRRQRYMAAYDALATSRLLGRPAIKAVNCVAIQDRACPWQWRPYLQWGLTALAEHFGLTGKRK